MMGYGDFGWIGSGGWFWMVLAMAAILALLVWGMGTQFVGRDRRAETTPRDILERRFAAGEISQTEFEQAKHVLA